MKQFYELYKDNEKVSPLVTQLSWTNHLMIMSACKTMDERMFYMNMCIKERLSKRELERQIDSGYYERYMLSQKPLTPAIEESKRATGNIFLDKDASPASFALRWVGTFPNVKVILSGMSTMEQVEDNLKTFADFKPLSDKEQEVIAEVRAILEARVRNGCTGCRYCMPCPAGVDIPGCFAAWNTYYAYQNYNVVRWSWEEGIGEAHQAKNCIKCGKCEGACPQKISIREDLEKVQADLDNKQLDI